MGVCAGEIGDVAQTLAQELFIGAPGTPINSGGSNGERC